MPDLDLSPPPAQIFRGELGKPRWSGADIARQAAVLGLLGVDWAQSRTIAKHPVDMRPDGTYDWKAETNPLLGDHPSSGKVNNYFAGAMIGHTLLMNALPPELRKWAQYGTIGLEAGATGRNKYLGIGMTF